jgi:hypothetical protein
MQTYKEYLRTMAAYRFYPMNIALWRDWQLHYHGYFLLDEGEMMRLLCPCCREAGLKWLLNDDCEKLDLEETIMQCQNRSCQLMYQGIPGWHEKRIYHGKPTEQSEECRN